MLLLFLSKIQNLLTVLPYMVTVRHAAGGMGGLPTLQIAPYPRTPQFLTRSTFADEIFLAIFSYL